MNYVRSKDLPLNLFAIFLRLPGKFPRKIADCASRDIQFPVAGVKQKLSGLSNGNITLVVEHECHCFDRGIVFHIVYHSNREICMDLFTRENITVLFCYVFRCRNHKFCRYKLLPDFSSSQLILVRILQDSPGRIQNDFACIFLLLSPMMFMTGLTTFLKATFCTAVMNGFVVW